LADREPATLQIEAIPPLQIPSEPLQFVPASISSSTPNAGKNKWLETLDYLLADDVSAAACEDPISPNMFSEFRFSDCRRAIHD